MEACKGKGLAAALTDFEVPEMTSIKISQCVGCFEIDFNRYINSS